MGMHKVGHSRKYRIDNIQWGKGSEQEGRVIDITADFHGEPNEASFTLTFRSDLSDLTNIDIPYSEYPDKGILNAILALTDMWIKHNLAKLYPEMYTEEEAALKESFEVDRGCRG